MKKNVFYAIASFFTFIAGFIVTPMSLTYLHSPEVPEELK